MGEHDKKRGSAHDRASRVFGWQKSGVHSFYL
jgi:hypothetical protein